MARTLAEMLAELVLSHLRAGELTIGRRDGSSRTLAGPLPGPHGRAELKTARAARRLLTGGALGVAEGYLDGDWDTDDLDTLLAVGAEHYAHQPVSVRSLATPLSRWAHRMRDNSVTGSRRNIAEHYDLGNDFYSLWLDETMTYSSALYASPGVPEPILSAQERKWDRLLDLLQPARGDHLLEIGCGWGGFALHAAKEAGCRVTGFTLSEEQHAWAQRAIEEQALEGLVDVRLQDYRHASGSFSGIVSIEMFEAVGERWWPVYFQRLRSLLPKGTAAAIQTITIDEGRFEDYRSNPDFIQRYIFPGGMLPSPERFVRSAHDAQLATGEPFFFGDSYASTIEEWSRRFEAALPGVRALGFDERFIRMWRYYLAYCRAGFSAGTIDVMQVRLEG